MKIAIVGGGFTGLSAALRLSESHQITLFEKEKTLGGLATTFKLPGWQWSVEKHYHHWFTNDSSAIGLIKKLGLSDKLIFPNSLTSVYYQGKIYPFNTPSQVLNFTPLSLPQRFCTGFISLFLKLLPISLAINLERYTAFAWLEKYFGSKTFRILWEPLLLGKFGGFAKTVNMAWFWARIKKRTLRLGYIEGGYKTLIDAVALTIKKNGGKIHLDESFNPKTTSEYDKVIITTPSSVFTKMFPTLPKDYKKRLNTIPHLHALNLLLVTREKFLRDTYWLNINDRSFPFIAVIQQTNLADAKYYGGNHLTWIGNYLPEGHPYLKMTKEELFHLYLPYLKKINPHFTSHFSLLTSHLFLGPFAQPVFPVNYSKIKPNFETPLPNVYLANMDMVYPWDRGTNYAIELGEEVADIVQ